MTKPTTMTGLLAASAILGVAGPFQSSEVLALVPRLLYWLVIVVSSYSCGYLVDALFRPALKARPIWQIVLALGVITGIGVTLIVLVMNIAIFGIFPPLKALPSFVLPIVAISMIISIAGGRQYKAHRSWTACHLKSEAHWFRCQSKTTMSGFKPCKVKA